MAYKVIILYQLYMPSYFLGTFTEYPYVEISREKPCFAKAFALLFFLVPVCPAFERLTHGLLIVLVGNLVGPTDGVRAVRKLFEHPRRLVARCAAHSES